MHTPFPVGFRQERPLPGPAAAAEELRQTSLQVVERWKDEFGKACPQARKRIRVHDCLLACMPCCDTRIVTGNQPANAKCVVYSLVNAQHLHLWYADMLQSHIP
jgi:hypothetical protein